MTVIVDEGHPEGRRLRDYDAFGDPASARNALLVECGQHWETRAVEVVRDCTARFLLASGVVEAGDLPAGWQPAAAPVADRRHGRALRACGSGTGPVTRRRPLA